jgi:hypothetical protein
MLRGTAKLFDQQLLARCDLERTRASCRPQRLIKIGERASASGSRRYPRFPSTLLRVVEKPRFYQHYSERKGGQAILVGDYRSRHTNKDPGDEKGKKKKTEEKKFFGWQCSSPPFFSNPALVAE